jgi:hypothetical protein
MTYRNYQVSIVVPSGLKFFEIVACDHDAAIADVRATYGEEVEVCSVCLL